MHANNPVTISSAYLGIEPKPGRYPFRLCGHWVTEPQRQAIL